MLKISDLTASKDLDTREMAEVRGGFDPFSIFAGTTIANTVADVEQAFAFGFAQSNVGEVTNNQAISGGNGVTYAPVDQHQSQHNDLFVSGIGNISVK